MSGMTYRRMAERAQDAHRILQYVAGEQLPEHDRADRAVRGRLPGLEGDMLEIAGALRSHALTAEPPPPAGSLPAAHRADYQKLEEHRKLSEAIRRYQATPACDGDLASELDALQVKLRHRSEQTVRRWD